MAIAIRTEKEIEMIRAAAEIVALVLQQLQKEAVAGVTTAQLAQISDEIIARQGGIALFKGVPNPMGKMDFPASICASINDEVVHGIPCDRQLQDGDVVSIDCGVRLKGYCGDAALTIPVGRIDETKRRLLQVTAEVLQLAVEHSRPGVLWSQVAAVMQRHAEAAGLSVVREYVGHGIGRKMHEDPKLPNFVCPDLLKHDILLRKGMVLAVEPMVNAGSHRVKTLADGWTVVTVDAQPSAHFEHTIAITADGAEILSRTGPLAAR